MFQVVVSEKGGSSFSQTFDKSEVAIGRVQENDLVLAKGNVSKQHGRIVFKDGQYVVVDLRSTNGVYVNGQRISAPQAIHPHDQIGIGDYVLEIEPLDDKPLENQRAEGSDVAQRLRKLHQELP